MGTFTETFSVHDINCATLVAGSQSVTVTGHHVVVTVNCGTGQTAGKAFNCVVSATGGTAPYTGTGTFPVTQPVKGTFTETFSVHDSNSPTLVAGSTSVTVTGQPVVVTVNCGTGQTAGKAFNCVVSATGGTAPYTGTGTFPVTQPVKGTFTETFSVHDSNSATLVAGSATVTVTGQPVVVTVNCGTGQTAGKAFNCVVSATGGTAPYTGTGTFPVTQPVKGTFTETFSVHDSNSATLVAGSATVTVTGQPVVVTVNCGTGQTAGKAFNCVVSATGGTAPYTGTGTFPVTQPVKGTFTETFSVHDSNSATLVAGSQSVTVTGQPVVVTVNCGTGQTAGKAFNCVVSATGGTAPYTGTGTFPVTQPVKGTFTETFSVHDSNSPTLVAGSTSVTVAAQPLVASFNFVPTNQSTGTSITFTATVTGGTSPYGFKWNFGDGSPLGTTNPVSHSYALKGPKTVTLNVTDINNKFVVSTQTVSVSGTALVVTVNCGTGQTAGKAFNCVVSATGGTA